MSALEALRRARAPGRVNLIGEHTDYNGLPVLPMALDRDVVLTYRARADGRVLVRNVDPRFEPVSFELEETIRPEPAGAWGNYPRAAAQALRSEVGPLRGLEGEVRSTVPVAAGLSSSSALVVATALALLELNQATVPTGRLMALLAAGERYVGVEGGGMDQAISLGGVAGHAIRIDFRPTLLRTPVPVPPEWRFVVAPSGIEAAKAAGAREAYNTRVRECRAALTRFADANLDGQVPEDYAALLALMPAAWALELAADTLDGDLLRRFHHVVSEGDRVRQAEMALRQGDPERFGRLMNASHASLRDDYAVSVGELDAMVEIALGHGAVGARLTGAGFGGAIVALARADRAGEVVEGLAREYYVPRGMTPAAFIAVPGPGARVE